MKHLIPILMLTIHFTTMPSAYAQQATNWKGQWRDGDDSKATIRQGAYDSESNVSTQERVRTVIQNPEAGIENPADALRKFNSIKADGNGRLQPEDGLAAHCIPKSNGFKCNNIRSASGFARAGILENDIILRVDGKKLSNKQGVHLLQKIENHQYSEITIIRDGRQTSLAAPIR